MRTIGKVFAITLLPMAILISIYFARAFQEFTCKGCLFVASLESCVKDHSLVAIYTSRTGNGSDTIYLARAIIHTGLYQHFSDDLYIGTVRNNKVKNGMVYADKRRDIRLATIKNGYITGLGSIDDIPLELRLTDSSKAIISIYTVMDSFPENIAHKPGRKYWREIRYVLDQY